MPSFVYDDFTTVNGNVVDSNGNSIYLRVDGGGWTSYQGRYNPGFQGVASGGGYIAVTNGDTMYTDDPVTPASQGDFTLEAAGLDLGTGVNIGSGNDVGAVFQFTDAYGGFGIFLGFKLTSGGASQIWLEIDGSSPDYGYYNSGNLTSPVSFTAGTFDLKLAVSSSLTVYNVYVNGTLLLTTTYTGGSMPPNPLPFGIQLNTDYSNPWPRIGKVDAYVGSSGTPTLPGPGASADFLLDTFTDTAATLATHIGEIGATWAKTLHADSNSNLLNLSVDTVVDSGVFHTTNYYNYVVQASGVPNQNAVANLTVTMKMVTEDVSYSSLSYGGFRLYPRGIFPELGGFYLSKFVGVDCAFGAFGNGRGHSWKVALVVNENGQDLSHTSGFAPNTYVGVDVIAGENLTLTLNVSADLKTIKLYRNGVVIDTINRTAIWKPIHTAGIALYVSSPQPYNPYQVVYDSVHGFTGTLGGATPVSDHTISLAYLTAMYSGGGTNSDHANSIGGLISNIPLVSQVPDYSQDISGVTIISMNGIPTGTVEMDFDHTTDVLKLKTPGDSDFGDGAVIHDSGFYALHGLVHGSVVVQVTALSLPTSNTNALFTASRPVSNLFSSLLKAKALAGETIYRCFYLKNNHPTDTAVGLRLYGTTQPVVGGISWGIDPAGIGDGSTHGIATLMPNGVTAPTGVTFSSPNNVDAALVIGDLGPGLSIPIWVRRVVAPSTVANRVTYKMPLLLAFN